MTAAVRERRRQRLLAEMGLVRYRLRGDGGRADAAAAMPAAQRANAEAAIALTVVARDAAALPASGAAAAVWAHVLAWLGLSPSQVRWSSAMAEGAVELPPPSSWPTPDGKRGLWLALKRFRRERG